MRFKKWPQLPGAGRIRAGHQHGSHTPTSPEAVLLGKMAYHTKQIHRQCMPGTHNFSFPTQSIKFANKKKIKRTFLLKYIIFLHLYDCWCISFLYCHIPNAGLESALEHLVKIRIFHPKCIILSENVSEGRRRIFSNTSRVMDKNTAD